MNRKILVTIAGMFVAAALSVAILATPASARMRLHHAVKSGTQHNTPPDSYLYYKVYTVPEFASEVASNPSIRHLYARHFGVPDSQVGSYLQHNLVASYVPANGYQTVYCVNPQGRIFSIRQYMKKGTKVLALRNGEPILKWACGNPLSRKLPRVKVSHNTVTVVHHVPVIKVSPSVEALVPSMPVENATPTEIASAPYQPGIPSVAATAVPVGTSPVLWPLALIPFGFIQTGHHGTPPNHPPLVPEPSPLATLLIGLTPIAVLVSWRYARRAR